MKADFVNSFVALALNDVAYKPRPKAKFHTLGKKVLRKVAEDLNLASNTYDIRSNMGGIAVSGEVTLHHEKIYIQLYQSSLGPRFMFRSCKGRKDYIGGTNQWMDFTQLLDWPTALIRFKSVLDNS